MKNASSAKKQRKHFFDDYSQYRFGCLSRAAVFFFLFPIFAGQNAVGTLERGGQLALAFITDFFGDFSEGIGRRAQKTGGVFHAVFLHMCGEGLAVDGFEQALERRSVDVVLLREHLNRAALAHIRHHLVVNPADERDLLGFIGALRGRGRVRHAEQQHQLLKLELGIGNQQPLRQSVERVEQRADLLRRGEHGKAVFSAEAG